MIGMLHYAIPASIFVIVLILLRYLWRDRDPDDASAWLKQLVPAAIAALLSWFALRFVENLLAVHFLAGGPRENAVAETASWTSLVYFVAMVVGMIAQSIWHALQNRKPNKPPIFDKWEFVKPALVAPIVFIAVYRNILEPQVSMVMLLFSFQNGFFWQTVLRTSKR
ncbi:hypothetical protein [Bradyrhizobium sp.]|uniref:hypothetical protein n=1 Tax=Bradyrhizobium sp. TaxID=376 RepID=UPI002634FC26|nr:hypothetical protein [Bradyrhizobium sp.]